MKKHRKPEMKKSEVLVVDGVSWKRMGLNTRATTVNGRHFLAARGSGRREWFLMETKRCMHEHGSSESLNGAQWKGVPTAKLSETVLNAVSLQAEALTVSAP